MKRRKDFGTGWIALALVALTVTVGVLILQGSNQADRRNPVVSSHGRQINELRTVVLQPNDTGLVSEPGRPLHAILRSGEMPASPVLATVLSDENCAPDAQGVSHCTNRMRLDDGGEITVTHPHRMADVPCLAPGERVRILQA